MDGIDRSYEIITSYDIQTLQLIYIICLDFDVCFMISHLLIAFYASNVTVNYF